MCVSPVSGRKTFESVKEFTLSIYPNLHTFLAFGAHVERGAEALVPQVISQGLAGAVVLAWI